MPDPRKPALVLAGGGARGAYEIGALSYLLPKLAQRYGQADWRPPIIVGTSAGALNAAFLGATADRPLGEALDEGGQLWGGMTWGKALAPTWSGALMYRALRGVALFNPKHLAGLLEGLGIRRIREILMQGASTLETVALVTTYAATSHTRVFFDSATLNSVNPDTGRGIQYLKTALTHEHALASAAIPSAFPAVELTTPGREKGWYSDGGTRLNTPIEPALRLGADGLIIVALHHAELGDPPAPGTAHLRPMIIDGATQIVQGLLVDPLLSEMRQIANENKMRYILVAPKGPNAIGEVAQHCYKDRYGGLGGALRMHESVGRLGRLFEAGSNPARGELFSYLFFEAGFAARLHALGAADAKKWFDDRPADPWLTGPLP